MVMFIYRPEYYKLTEETGLPPGTAQIIIAKHRNGQTGEVNLKFVNKFAKFVNPEQDFSAMGTGQNIPYGGYGNDYDQDANVRVMPSKMNNFNNDEAPF